MVTKDQLELLRRSLQQNKSMQLTIGGTVEANVNERSHNERAKQYHKGQKSMAEASQNFRREMKAKADGSLNPQSIPASDEKIANDTWQKNALDFHEGKFKSAQDNFRTQARKAFSSKTRSR